MHEKSRAWDGSRLKQARLDRGLTPADLGMRLGVARQQINRWERTAAAPHVDTIRRLAAILWVDECWLAFGAPRCR